MAAIRSGWSAWRHSQTLRDRDRRRDVRELILLLAAATFIFTNAVAFSLVRESAVRWTHLYAPLIWLTLAVASHLVLRTMKPSRDPFLFPLVALLAGWGLLLQDRLAPNFLGRQTLWLVLATAAMLFVATVPKTLQPLMRYRYLLLIGGLLLLAVTLVFGVNPSASGAALWLPVPFPFLGIVYFQPSELLKLLLVIFLASYFTEREPLFRYRRRVNRQNDSGATQALKNLGYHLPFLGPLLLMWGFALLLLVWQRDLGAAALFFIVFIALVYMATGELTYVWGGVALLLLAGILAFFVFDTVVAPRVLSWINPWPNVSDRAYQIVQALYAQAAGGLIGQGIGQGYPDFIPVVHSDFALAAVAEEWGLLGSLSVVACFGLLAARGLRVALLAIRGRRPRYFHAYLAAGLVVLFSAQSFLIMGGVTRLLPLTGITLPFISYGGSSLLVSSLAVGLLLYLSADAEPPSAAAPNDPELARRIERIGIAILIVFGVISLALTHWSIVRGDALAAREDNPRLIEAERAVQRGRILDQNEASLAESVGPDNFLTRVYPLPEAGPAVGYYSLRFGESGVEDAYNEHLRGGSDSFWVEAARRLMHRPAVGGDVRLTLDAGLQERATALMADLDVAGGLVLLELTEIGGEPVAEIRAMVSQPGYDPNRIDDEFESLAAIDPGPLFNRAAQGLYQPGLILQSLITAAAVDEGALQLSDALAEPYLPVAINGNVLRCAEPRVEGDTTAHTWGDMATLRCPSPLQSLGNTLGAGALDSIFARFGLYSAPDLPIPTEGGAAVIADPGLAAIGQEALTVTPLQAALATAALADDGRLPTPRLVEALADPGGAWEAQPAGSAVTTPAVSSEAAAAVRESWPVEDHMSGFSTTVLAGPEGSRNAWFVGMTPANNPRYVVALVLEGVEDAAVAEEMGRELLSQVDGITENPASLLTFIGD